MCIRDRGFLDPAGRFGQVFDVDADDRAAHDRRNAMVGPVSAAAEPGMQVVPGRCAHGPVTWVGGCADFIGGGPGVRFGAFEPCAVAARPASLCAAGSLGVGVEDTVITAPDDKIGGHVGEGVGECGRIVACLLYTSPSP